MRAATAFVLAALWSAACAGATVLEVGPAGGYASIAEAAIAAQDGDTIRIASGNYGCAEFTASNLTIQGIGASPLVSGPVCHGRALFWFATTSNNITVDNIAFSGAVDDSGNGAGILFNGSNLAVIGSTFTRNQDGLLIASHRGSSVSVDTSVFDANGACVKGKGCAHGIYANGIDKLTVTDSTFTNTKAGHHIKSRARSTEVTGSTISDGPNGTASYLIDISDGGDVLISGNTLEKGPRATNHSAAIAIGAESRKNLTTQIVIAGNLFANDMAVPTVFVWNYTATPAMLSGNSLTGRKTTALKGKGSVSAAAALRLAAVPEPPGAFILAGALFLLAGLRRRSTRPSGYC